MGGAVPPVAMTEGKLKIVREARLGCYNFAGEGAAWAVVSAQLVENRGDEGTGQRLGVTDNDGEWRGEGSPEEI